MVDEEYKGLAERYEPIKKKKLKKVKMQCCYCGYIDYRLTCPKCNHGMFKYEDRIGIKFKKDG